MAPTKSTLKRSPSWNFDNRAIPRLLFVPSVLMDWGCGFFFGNTFTSITLPKRRSSVLPADGTVNKPFFRCGFEAVCRRQGFNYPKEYYFLRFHVLAHPGLVVLTSPTEN